MKENIRTNIRNTLHLGSGLIFARDKLALTAGALSIGGSLANLELGNYKQAAGLLILPLVLAGLSAIDNILNRETIKNGGRKSE